MVTRGPSPQTSGVVLRGVAGRTRAGALLVVGAVAALLPVLQIADRAGADPQGARCDRFAAASAARAATVTGTGDDVLVVGDSYAVGLGLDDPLAGWPSRLPGRVHVTAFSGSGFSRTASPCGPVSFGARAPEGVRRSGAALVVVAGGLNDWDQEPEAITAGFERLVAAVGDRTLVVVGPVTAPARAARVPAVDALLAGLSAAHGATYLSMVDLDLSYLDDRLHLTERGHRVLGDAVAARMAGIRS